MVSGVAVATGTLGDEVSYLHTVVRGDHFRCLLANNHGRGVGVSAHYIRHDARVCHA